MPAFGATSLQLLPLQPTTAELPVKLVLMVQPGEVGPVVISMLNINDHYPDG